MSRPGLDSDADLDLMLTDLDLSVARTATLRRNGGGVRVRVQEVKENAGELGLNISLRLLPGFDLATST